MQLKRATYLIHLRLFKQKETNVKKERKVTSFFMSDLYKMFGGVDVFCIGCKYIIINRAFSIEAVYYYRRNIYWQCTLVFGGLYAVSNNNSVLLFVF